MARSRTPRNGKVDKLDEAMTALVHAQATLVQNQALHQAEMRELERQTAERFRQLEQRLARVEAILLEHSRTLQALPDAVREKIGFKVPSA